MDIDEPELFAAAISADTTESVKKDVAPFLSKHIPKQYAPQGAGSGGASLSREQLESQEQDGHGGGGGDEGEKNTRFCYRHRPDLKCRRPADEPTMDQLQSSMDSLPDADRQAIAHVWSLFSAAPAQMRKTMLQGILQQCCFPQLSYLSAAVRDLVRIDFLSTLPPEISFKILSYLDTTSLCKAAQVSRTWRMLADDDVVWHKMCEQHIDRKCDKCGWGLPLLERKRLRASKRRMEMRAREPSLFTLQQHQQTHHITTGTSRLNIHGKRPENPTNAEASGPSAPSGSRRAASAAAAAAAAAAVSSAAAASSSSSSSSSAPSSSSTPSSSASASNRSSSKRACQRPEPPSAGSESPASSSSSPSPRRQPWKKVFSERYKVESNWRRGRCTKKIFKGHSDGIMCLQFDDQILATGSYDSTIKIWDIESGEEVRTLFGHTSGVRALQFDDTKLISGSLDKTLRIWNYRTGDCISTLRGHTDGVVCLHFDSTLLASGSVDKTIKVWNFVDKECFALKGHSDWVNAVRIDSDSRTIFSASDDQTVRMWDLDTRSCVRTFHGHVGHVQQVIPLSLPDYVPPPPCSSASAAATTATAVAAASPPRTPTPTPWEYRDPATTATAATAAAAVAAAAAADGSSRVCKPPPGMLLTAALDNTVKFWDVSSGRCFKTLFGHVQGVWALAADTLRIVSGAQDSMVKVWDVNTGRCLRTVTGHAGPVTCVGLSDSRMVTAGEDSTARMYCFKCPAPGQEPEELKGEGAERGGSGYESS